MVWEELYSHVSGEFRWIYHDGHPFLSGRMRTPISGQFAHVHLRHSTGHRFRPYFYGGVGAKGYIIAGPEANPQPIPSVALLLAHEQWKLVPDVGGGIKYQVRPHLILRNDFRDYLTSFPRNQIVPATGNTARGILQQFTAMFEVSYWF